MNQYVARLIRTGMPRKIALFMVSFFRSVPALEKYVEEVEAECCVQMEAV